MMRRLLRQRQEAGTKVVILEWLICDRCRHVVLGSWQFIEPIGASTKNARDERSTGMGQEPG